MLKDMKERDVVEALQIKIERFHQSVAELHSVLLARCLDSARRYFRPKDLRKMGPRDGEELTDSGAYVEQVAPTRMLEQLLESPPPQSVIRSPQIQPCVVFTLCGVKTNDALHRRPRIVQHIAAGIATAKVIGFIQNDERGATAKWAMRQPLEIQSGRNEFDFSRLWHKFHPIGFT